MKMLVFETKGRGDVTIMVAINPNKIESVRRSSNMNSCDIYTSDAAINYPGPFDELVKRIEDCVNDFQVINGEEGSIFAPGEMKEFKEAIDITSKFMGRRQHKLYEKHDKGCPRQIKDRNGEVVLSLCKVCGGAEASLPTHCPGYHMTFNEQESVQNGRQDFIDDKWVPLEKKSNE